MYKNWIILPLEPFRAKRAVFVTQCQPATLYICQQFSIKCAGRLRMKSASGNWTITSKTTSKYGRHGISCMPHPTLSIGSQEGCRAKLGGEAAFTDGPGGGRVNILRHHAFPPEQKVYVFTLDT